ncbi:MAG TPA: DUF6763 family protein [Nevskiales bacterium]|nr:DUF6763 family protein [Nevskiales bacterium]
MQVQPHNVVVGDWYCVGTEPPFEVVAVDADQETIEIQYFDGTVEEVDFDSWLEMAPQPSPPPEDWSGAMDVDKEDYGIDPDRLITDSWESPLDQLDRLG